MNLPDRHPTNESTDQTVDVQANRRAFLKGVSLAMPAVGGGLALTLNGCGGSSSGDPLAIDPASVVPAAKALDVAETAVATTTVRIQARKVEWVAGQRPATPNAWVYVTGAAAADTSVLPSHLGPTFNFRRNATAQIAWVNDLGADPTNPRLLASPPVNAPLTQDVCGRVQTQSDVGCSVHVHGARVQAAYDGWPLSPIGYAANPYNFPTTRTYSYPNVQRSAMLWYHDHALDRTAKHVYAGLAGVYFIRDEADDQILAKIGGAPQELLCVLQDRILRADKLGVDYSAGMPVGPEGFERPEFLGSTLFVNGRPSPSTTLARRTYRLRILNASQARTYALGLVDVRAMGGAGGRVWYNDRIRLIGTDAGLISKSVVMSPTAPLIIAPGQRRDILVDLSGVPSWVTSLRLVNYALKPDQDAVATPGAVGIYTDFAGSVLTPSQLNYDPRDAALYGWLASSLGQVVNISLSGMAVAGATTSPSTAAIDAVLGACANDDDFLWSNGALVPRAGAEFGPNRLILLMSNTAGRAVEEVANGVSGWTDVQILETSAGTAAGATPFWTVPFAVDLATRKNPAAGTPSAAAAPRNYVVSRKSFFAKETNPDITQAGVYPPLHAPSIVAKQGTYERWYVANVGNALPLVGDPNAPPDMHPFHVHLVSGVVNRRWLLNANGTFVPKTSMPSDVDRIARQDTVRIESNEMVELIVYYPPGYTGDYAYHCHLLEHEDMCMMSHFTVTK